MDISNILCGKIKLDNGIWFSDTRGYWSFFNQQKTQRLLADLFELGCLGMVRKEFPQYEDLIFSPKRYGGIGMLDFHPDDIVVDIGCMWGALTVPIARTNCKVIGLDQTKESLLFLKKRLEEEGLENVDLVCADVKKIDFKDSSVDKFVVNGILEWIPQICKVEVEHYYMKKDKNKNIFKKISNYYKNNPSPIEMQCNFLKKLNKGLKKGGILYLAIENRFFVAFFLGFRDHHTGLRFVDILPRCMQTPYSFLLSGRPFTTWTYSEKKLKQLLYSSGFSHVKLKYAFPDYHFPELILSAESMDLFQPVRYRLSDKKYMKLLWWLLENVFYCTLKLKSLSPAFIAIAQK